jgi:hypothetical protein
MIDRIAHQMEQRILQLFEHGRINLNVSSDHFQPSQFPMALREVSHGTDKLAENGSDWDHSDTPHFTLQVHVQTLGLAMHLQDGASLFGVELLNHLPQAALRNHNLTCQIQHVVEFVDIRAQGAVTGTRERLSLCR